MVTTTDMNDFERELIQEAKPELFYSRIQQEVNKHDVKEFHFLRKSYVMSQFKNGLSPEEIYKDVFPHGISMSVKHSIPVVEEALRSVKAFADNVMPTSDVGKYPLAPLNYVSTGCISICMISVLIHASPKNSRIEKFLKDLKFAIHIMVYLYVLYFMYNVADASCQAANVLVTRYWDEAWPVYKSFVVSWFNDRDSSSAEQEDSYTEKEINEDLEMVVVPQGLGEYSNELTTTLVALLSVATGYKPKQPFLQGIVNLTKVSSTQTKNISLFIISSFNAISEFFTAIGKENIARYFEVEKSESIEVNVVLEKVSKFVSATNAGSMHSYLHFTRVYQAYHDELVSLMKLVDKNDVDYKLLNSCLRDLRDAYARTDAQKHSLNGSRVEPVGILIRGPPGCFKSTLCSRITSLVTKLTLPKEWMDDYEANPKDFMFSLPKDKFYEGYTNKAWFTTADDLFQTRDIAGDPESDALKVIKLINEMPFPLPMANVESKGTVYFNSPFFIATSNLSNWNSLESVVSPEAVRRRFTLEIEVSINEKYKKHGLNGVDIDLLPTIQFDFDDETLFGTTIPNDFWNLSVISKFANNVNAPIKASLEDVVFMVRNEHFMRVRNFYINKAANDAAKNSFNFKSSDGITPEIKDLYSRMFLSTVYPQSGLSKPTPEHVQSVINDNLSKELRELLLSSIYHLLLMYDNRSTSLAVTFDFTKFISLMCMSPRSIELVSLLNRSGGVDMAAILNVCQRHIEDMLDNKLNPCTGRLLDERYTWKVHEDEVNLKNTLASVGKTCADFVNKYKFYILVGLPLAMASMYYINKILTNIVSTVDSEIKPHSVDFSRDRAKTPGKRVTKNLAARIKDLNIKPHGSDLRVSEEEITESLEKISVEDMGTISSTNGIITSVINKYQFILYLVRPTSAVRIGHVVNVISNVFLMPMHFLYQLVDVIEDEPDIPHSIVLSTATKSTRYSCTLKDFLDNFRTTDEMADKDMVLIKIPSAHRNSKGILPYVMNDRDLERLRTTSRTFSASVIGTYNKLNNKSLLVRQAVVKASFHGDIVVQADWRLAKDEPLYGLSEVVKYDGSFGFGDCGSLVYVNSNNFKNKHIIGIHVAGNEGTGFSSVFSAEKLEFLLEKTGYSDFKVQSDNNAEYVDSFPIVAQGYKKPVGYVTGKDVPLTVYKSEYKRSRLYAKLPYPYNKVEHMPAKLRPFVAENELGQSVEIDPMKVAMSNYGKYSRPFPVQLVNGAIDSYECLINEEMNTPREGRIIVPLEQALHSFDSINGISSSTSAGYPMSQPHNENIKKYYYEACYENDEEKKSFYYSRIAEEVNRRKDSYIMGHRVPVYYKDVLKDELRKNSKVASGQTRMFSACDFIYLVMCRMYFGKFLNAYVDANYKVGSAIGINPYSREWDVVARELLKYSQDSSVSNIGAGDFKTYDSDQNPQVLWAVFEVILRWYGTNATENDKQIMFMLFSEITNSKHVNNSYIYEWQSGIPSGNPLTSLLNSIYNHILFRMAYSLAGYEVSNFNENVYLIVLGDDNLFSVSTAVMERFNEMDMPTYMRKLHMTYTTELKGEATVKFRKLTEVEFLKRSFRFDKKLNRYVAPMNLESIFRPLNWTKKGMMGDQIVVDTCQSGILELSLHGKEVFDKFATTLHELRSRCYPEVKPSLALTLNYDAVYSKVLSLDYMW